jgi:hypothetical protein
MTLASTMQTLASTAILPAPLPMDSVAWDSGIDQEVEALLRAERGDSELAVAPIPPPAKAPKLTSSLLFKVPGGVSGELGKKLVRAKEVERRLGIARTQLNTSHRENKNQLTENSDWTVAAEGLGLLKTNQFDLIKLNKPQLQSLVRVLKVGNANQNKGALKDMLTSRFGDITPTQFRYRDDGATGHRIGFAAACPERPPRAPNARSRGCHPTTARGGQSPGFAASRDTLELSVA